MVLTETSSTCSWASGGVWPRQHRWRRSVLHPEWRSWKHMEIRSWTEEHPLQPAQKQPWLLTIWVSGRKIMNFSLLCFSNDCIGGCVTEIWIRTVCKIVRLLSYVSSKPVELDDGSIMINVRNTILKTITASVVWLYAVWMEESLCRWSTWCLITRWRILRLQLEL